MQDIYAMAAHLSDSEDDEQLLIVGLISTKSTDESKQMKVSSPQINLTSENDVKRGKRRGGYRKLDHKPTKRNTHNQLSNSDSDLDDEVIIVGRTSTEKAEMVRTENGNCESQGGSNRTRQNLQSEALTSKCNAKETVLQNVGQTVVETTLERGTTQMETNSVQLDGNDCISYKGSPCLAVPPDDTSKWNLSRTLKNWDVEQTTSPRRKRKSKLERIPLKPKCRRQHRKTDCRRKGNDKEALMEATPPCDVTDGGKVSKQELWFEHLGEKEDSEISPSLGNQCDVSRPIETNNNNGDAKDAETLVVKQSNSFTEMDSDDELIDPSLEIDEEDFNEGDLVWARHPRNPFWPAVVKEISDGRQKKITVEYFNPGADVYRCQYSVRAIRPFIHFRKKMLMAGYHSEHAESFRVAVQEATDYLRERAVGKDIMLTTPVKEALSDQPNIHCQSIDSPPLTPTECQTTPLSPGATCSTPSNGHRSPPSPKVRIGLTRLFSDSEVSKNSIAKDKEKDKLKKKWEKIEDRLMKIILQDETKERLLKIWKGKVKSDRHKIFFSSSIKERNNLKYYAHLGALTTEEKIDKIADYLNEIWRHNCQKNKEDLPNNAYIFEVWLPEAILFSVMKSRRIGRKKAEQVIISEGRQVVKELEMK